MTLNFPERPLAARRVVPVVVLATVLAQLAGCGQSKGPGMGGFAVMVGVKTLHAGPVSLETELPGRTSAFLVADVRPQVGGIVQKRLFTEGSLVKAGQPLYQIDDALYRAQLGNAQAALARADAAAHVAGLAADRSSQLFKTQLVSRQDNDAALATARQAEADVAAARAAVEAAQLNVTYARVLAPISGRIGKSSVTPGALVTANQAAALATLQQLDPIYVDVTQPAGDWLALRRQVASGAVHGRGAGTPVHLTLEDGSAYAHEGRLEFTDVTVDPATGNFLLRALVPNPEGLLLPGMFVRARLVQGLQPSGLLVPQAAVQHDPSGKAFAWVVGGDGKVAQKFVQLGRSVGTDWLVASGLADGDRVVVAGLQKVQPGMAVQATEEGSAPAGAPGAPGGGGRPGTGAPGPAAQGR